MGESSSLDLDSIASSGGIDLGAWRRLAEEVRRMGLNKVCELVGF
ncbi:MAG: hypothetical protein NDF55_03420 [archaeon GB-1867-005]|nr:hypothetical protein [Candidatus Culexmicrobium cathedralense]